MSVLITVRGCDVFDVADDIVASPSEITGVYFAAARGLAAEGEILSEHPPEGGPQARLQGDQGAHLYLPAHRHGLRCGQGQGR